MAQVRVANSKLNVATRAALARSLRGTGQPTSRFERAKSLVSRAGAKADESQKA